MPNIKERQDTALDIRPTEVGIDATAGAARRIGAFYNQTAGALESTGHRAGSAIQAAGDTYVKYEDHREISAGNAAGAQIINGLTQKWNETAKNADPNDPSVAGKFREEVLEPTLQKFNSGFSTERSQAWAEHYIDQFRQHMFQKTSADMSSLAADAVHTNVLKTGNALGNAVYNDPSSLDFARGASKSSIEGLTGSSPNITAVQAGKINTELGFKTEQHLVNSAIQGAIAKGGDWKRIADDPKNSPYIDQREVDRYVREEKQHQRAERSDYENNRRRAKEEAQDRSTDSANQYLIDVRSRDPKLKNDPTAMKILNDPTLLKSDKNNLLNLIDRQVKPETDTRISNDTMIDFMKELRPGNRKDLDAEAFEQRLWDARVKPPGEGGSLNEAHFNQLRKELQDRKTPEGLALSEDRNRFLSDFGAAIDGGMTGNVHSALGKQKMAEARDEMLAREEQLKKDGKNPRDLYRRSSESYFDKDGAGSKKYGVGLQSTLNYWASIGAGSDVAKAKGLTKENPVEIPAGMTLQKAREQGIPAGTFIKLPSGDIKVMP